MKHFIKRFPMVIVLVMLICNSAFAVTVYGLHLPANQVWVGGGSVSRSGNYSYVYARCMSVYPDNNDNDTYKKIQGRITYNGAVISEKSYYVIKEGNGDYELKVKDGYLGLSKVAIEFRGNSNKSAYADVFYDGM